MNSLKSVTSGMMTSSTSLKQGKEIAYELVDLKVKAKELTIEQGNSYKKDIGACNSIFEVDNLMKKWGYYDLYKQELDKLKTGAGNRITPQQMLELTRQGNEQRAAVLGAQDNENAKGRKKANDYFWENKERHS